MSTERPTKEITTSGGHKATLFDWITVQEFRAIMAIYLDATTGMNVDTKKETAELKGSPAQAGMRAQDKSIEYVVKDLDGSADNIVARFLELPQVDGQEIIEAVEAISNPKKK